MVEFYERKLEMAEMQESLAVKGMEKELQSIGSTLLGEEVSLDEVAFQSERLARLVSAVRELQAYTRRCQESLDAEYKERDKQRELEKAREVVKEAEESER